MYVVHIRPIHHCTVLYVVNSTHYCTAYVVHIHPIHHCTVLYVVNSTHYCTAYVVHIHPIHHCTLYYMWYSMHITALYMWYLFILYIIALYIRCGASCTLQHCICGYKLHIIALCTICCASCTLLDCASAYLCELIESYTPGTSLLSQSNWLQLKHLELDMLMKVVAYMSIWDLSGGISTKLRQRPSSII